jgi:hypothetical protein
MGLVDLGRWQTEAGYVMADQGARDYLQQSIPELSDKVLTEKIYYLMPQALLDNEAVRADMQSIAYAYYLTETEYEIIGYREPAWIMAISNRGRVDSTLKRNPVIIFNNIADLTIPLDSILYLSNATMYRLSAAEFEEVARRNDFDGLHHRTNVYENYLYSWALIRRGLFMGVVFLIILLLLEGLILRSILRYEYQVNAKFLLLSKIHGETGLYRMRKVLLSLSGGILSLLVSVILCLILELTTLFYILTGGCLVIVLEYFFIMVYSRKLDQANISKIFKGGSL